MRTTRAERDYKSRLHCAYPAQCGVPNGCVDELKRILGRHAFAALRLFSRCLDTGEQLNLTGKLVERCVFGKLLYEVYNYVSVTLGGDFS